MKHLKNILIAVLSIFLISSCDKDEDITTQYGGKGKLMFGAVLNDLISSKSSLKQAFPVCSDETPTFVEVVLSGPTNVGTMSEPLVITVNPTPGNFDGDSGAEYFTNESTELELEPGTYTLEFFAVYDGDPLMEESNRIWVAPIIGSPLANYVDLALPMDFNLRAGVKKYLDVEVLCFDERLVNEYGYLFFDIEPRRAVEYCFFVNYCTPDGRDFPAAYSVDIYLGTNENAPLLFSNIMNATTFNEDAAVAEPLCLALPDLPQYEDDEAYIYYEITLMAWDEVYPYIAMEPITGTLSRNNIRENFGPDNSVFYEHLRFGCEDQGQDPCPNGTVDTDKDGIFDECDPCPLIPFWLDDDGDCLPNNEDPCPEDSANNCNPEEPCEPQSCFKSETAWMWGDHTLTRKDNDGLSLSAKWGWAEKFEVGQEHTSFKMYAAAGKNNPATGFLSGEVMIRVEGSMVTISVKAEPGIKLDKLDLYLSDNKPVSAAPGSFSSNAGITDEEPCSSEENIYVLEYSGDGSFWVMIHGEVCKEN
ncbi:thrombospondin type 3 repeat-containing protein [Salinimicrobium sp. GXAS 041]|uniref:thrombospondin type 3 repeat-containing protein n=1 Tax=Salinimicrobium sp. GXAS 041 TaxID=3400806 RepID=UPI003C74E3EF